MYSGMHVDWINTDFLNVIFIAYPELGVTTYDQKIRFGDVFDIINSSAGNFMYVLPEIAMPLSGEYLIEVLYLSSGKI